MCPSGCLMLYEAGMSLKTVTCPCGRGFWNVFDEVFVPGDRAAQPGAKSRREYEAQVKAELKADRYEAMLREQFIRHFLKCETGRAVEAKEAQAGRSNTLAKRLGQAELEEIKRRDFSSHGSSLYSAAVQACSRGSVKTRNDAEKLLAQELHKQGIKPIIKSHFAHLVDDLMSGLLITQFSPSADIDLKVLESWLRTHMGSAATAKAYTHPDGRSGYLITADTVLTKDMIAQIKKESIKSMSTHRPTASIDERDASSTDRRTFERSQMPQRDSRSARDDESTSDAARLNVDRERNTFSDTRDPRSPDRRYSLVRASGDPATSSSRDPDPRSPARRESVTQLPISREMREPRSSSREVRDRRPLSRKAEQTESRRETTSRESRTDVQENGQSIGRPGARLSGERTPSRERRYHR